MTSNYGMVLGLVLPGVVIAYFFLFAKPQQTVVRSTKSAQGEVAEISAYQDNRLLGTYSADLIVTSREGQILVKTNLLMSRDAIEDVSVEFPSIEIKDDKVLLTTQHNHYKGPDEFRFK